MKPSSSSKNSSLKTKRPTDRELVERLKDMPDEAIDYSDIPELDDAFFEAASRKKPITIRLKPEVIDFFKAQGPGYQTRISKLLEEFVRRQKR